MFDPADVRDAILAYCENNYYEGFGAFSNYDYKPGHEFDVPGLGSVRIVDYKDYDDKKNYSGWSEDLHVVFDVAGTLYMAKGSYMSYTGSTWENELAVVVPKEKTVTYFEEVE